jgi:hypothetical protein
MLILKLLFHILIVFCFYLNIRIIYQVANSDKFKEVSWKHANHADYSITHKTNDGICGVFRSCFKSARKRNFEDTSPLVDPRRSPDSKKRIDNHNGIDNCGNDNDKSTPTVIDLLDDDDDDDDDEEEEEEGKEACNIANEEGTTEENEEGDTVINRAGGEIVIDLLEEDDDDDDKDQSIIHQTIERSKNKQASRGNTNEDENARTNQSEVVNNDEQIMVDREEESIVDLLDDDDNDDDDDDDVVVLEHGQAVEFQIEVNNAGNNDDDCEDAVIVGSIGKNANSDYPHSRGDCATNPFEKDPKMYCPNVSKVVFVLMSCFVCYTM